MSVFGAVVSAFFPSGRNPDEPTFARLAETASYRSVFAGYAPYRGDHERPDGSATEKRAVALHGMILAAEAARTAEVETLLAREGISASASPGDWDRIGDWLGERVEGSREPGSDRTSPYVDGYPGAAPKEIDGESTAELRPLLRSLAFDLGLLLGRRLIERAPGARWARDGEQRKGSVSGEPVVLSPDGRVFWPFRDVTVFLHAALLARLGLGAARARRLGDVLRTAGAASDPAVDDPEAAFVAHLRQYIEDNGAPPDKAEIGWMLSEHRLDELPALPPDLAARLC